MVGLWGGGAQQFLLVFGIVGGLAFALPLFLVPISWARVFRWSLPDDTDLAVYFGRCLGAVIVVLNYFVLRAALTGDGVELIFQIIIAIFALMTVVHVWGALQRIQPLTETLEIGFWAALVLLGLLFYPA